MTRSRKLIAVLPCNDLDASEAFYAARNLLARGRAASVEPVPLAVAI